MTPPRDQDDADAEKKPAQAIATQSFEGDYRPSSQAPPPPSGAARVDPVQSEFLMRLANTLNVTFPGMDAESLLINLDLEGVCASSGSACMVGSIVPSHVLTAMGRTPEVAQATVRFSLGKWTTSEEIERTIAVLPAIVARLRQPDDTR